MLRRLAGAALLLATVSAAAAAIAQDADDRRVDRERMVRDVGLVVFFTSEETGVQVLDPKVMTALATVPRHAFVPAPLQPFAYEDRPLPLGLGQNIAQPFLIGLMTHLLKLEPDDVVLETGTGAGYHAAVLAELAARVYSVEVVAPLAEVAAATLRTLGYDKIETLTGDGYYGWAEHGPYDAILLKEAVDHIPPPLLAQLKPGGRMVLPLGPLNGPQQLTVIEKGVNGTLRELRVLEVSFSPLQGGDRI